MKGYYDSLLRTVSKIHNGVFIGAAMLHALPTSSFFIYDNITRKEENDKIKLSPLEKISTVATILAAGASLLRISKRWKPYRLSAGCNKRH